jgi:hypothetical protein
LLEWTETHVSARWRQRESALLELLQDDRAAALHRRFDARP